MLIASGRSASALIKWAAMTGPSAISRWHSRSSSTRVGRSAARVRHFIRLGVWNDVRSAEQYVLLEAASGGDARTPGAGCLSPAANTAAATSSASVAAPCPVVAATLHVADRDIAMEALIARFGLVVIFLGACLEGDLVLVLAGVTAHMGLVDLPLALGAGAAGCLTGDVLLFGVGRSRSAAIQQSRLYRAVGPAVERVAARLGYWQILASRAMYGTRVATMLFWGVRRSAVKKFLLTDAVGCAAWAGLLGMVGFAASNGATTILGEVRRAELWLLGAAGVALVVLLAVRLLLKRFRVGVTAADENP